MALLACSDSLDRTEVPLAHGSWTTETAWRVSRTPGFEISGGDSEEAPADPANFFRLPSGKHVIPDGEQNGAHRLLIYDRNGRYLDSWGKKGPGPGEFSHLAGWSGLFGVDSVAVQDAGGNEIELFSAQGSFGRAHKLPARGRVLALFPNGNLVLLGSSAPDGTTDLNVLMYNDKSDLARRIATFPAAPRSRGFTDPYVGPSPTVKVGKEHVYYTNGLDFLVEVYDTLGQHVRTFERDLARVAMTSADRRQITERLVEENRLRSGDARLAAEYEKVLRSSARWSEYRTAWGDIQEDAEGNVWLEHYRFIYPHLHPRDGPDTVWSIFDAQGDFLGEVTVPFRVAVTSIYGDDLLGIWQDSMDVKHARSYRLIKPK